ncbi:MAG: hypothetical protein ACRDWH_09955 [Acidimicrobiia bacterium]
MTRSPHRISRRRAAAECRQGHHRFGPGNEAGGGIVRRICRYCGVLSIDLTGVEARKALSFTIDRRATRPSTTPR